MQTQRLSPTSTIDITAKADKSQCLGQNLSRWPTVLLVNQDLKAFYNIVAKQAGVSLNEFIITAIDEQMKNEAPEIYNDAAARENRSGIAKGKAMVE